MLSSDINTSDMAYFKCLVRTQSPLLWNTLTNPTTALAQFIYTLLEPLSIPGSL